jgi:hypothetical protein
MQDSETIGIAPALAQGVDDAMVGDGKTQPMITDIVTSRLIPCVKPTHYVVWTHKSRSDSLMLYVPSDADPIMHAAARVSEQWPNLRGHTIKVGACK